MSRSKKSRKTGLVGVPKSDNKPTVASKKRRKKSSGNASGARNSDHLTKPSQPGRAKQATDRRIGSKKPISLLSEPLNKPHKQTVNKPKFTSPREELDFIENDPRFNSLLDKQEQNQTLTEDEKLFIQQQLSRHAVLCELLGITDDVEDTSEDQTEGTDEDNLLDKLENPDFRSF